jgi:hypothetical protein
MADYPPDGSGQSGAQSGWWDESATEVVSGVCPDELERQLRARLDALGPAPRAEQLHVLILPDLERPISASSGSYPQSRTFLELLIDSEEDRALPVASAVRPDP